MAARIPPDWVISPVLETLPHPDTGLPVFARQSYICRDGQGNYVCASGAREDCEAQALAMAQAHTQ